MSEPGPAQKSAGAYRTISEVAADLKLPQHVLRFWETRFSQVKPLKRAGGRRFYRPEDVELLRAVKALLYGDGYTIKGVQRILREQGPRAVAALAASPSGSGSKRAATPAAAGPVGGAVSSEPAAETRPEPVVALATATRSVARQLAPPIAQIECSGDPLSRLRLVAAELSDCVQMLAKARSPSV